MFSAPHCCTWAVSHWQQLTITLQCDHCSQDRCQQCCVLSDLLDATMPVISCGSVIFINLKTQSSLPKAWLHFLPAPLSALGWWGWGQQPWKPALIPSAPPSLLLLLSQPQTQTSCLSPASTVSPKAGAFLLLLSPFLPLPLWFVTPSCSAPASRSCVRRCHWPCYSEFYKYFPWSAEIWFFPRKQANNTFQLRSHWREAVGLHRQVFSTLISLIRISSWRRNQSALRMRLLVMQGEILGSKEPGRYLLSMIYLYSGLEIHL